MSGRRRLVDPLLVTGFQYNVHAAREEMVGLFAAFVGQARAVRRLGSAALDLCYVAAGRIDGYWEATTQAVGRRRRRADRGRGGRPGDPLAANRSVARGKVLATNGRLHEEMLEVIPSFKSPQTRTF